MVEEPDSLFPLPAYIFQTIVDCTLVLLLSAAAWAAFFSTPSIGSIGLKLGLQGGMKSTIAPARLTIASTEDTASPRLALNFANVVNNNIVYTSAVPLLIE